MRNTKKKKIKIILSFIAIIVLCSIGLVACQKDETNDINNSQNDINNKKQESENIEDIIGGSILDDSQAGIVESGEESGDTSVNVGLYSTENRAVFNLGNVYYLVYDFDGEKVSGLSYYYTYEDENAAQSSYNYFQNALRNNELSEIKDVKKDGKYIILTVNEEEYTNTTKETVMEAYSYLELIYDNNSGEVDE